MVVLTVDYGRPPWVALLLAGSFGTYGLAKKQANAGAVECLAFETALLAPLAAAYLGWLAWQGDSGFGAHGVGHALLLMTTGIVTALPLICFGAAATRLPLVTIGLLQYLAPVLQFVTGLLIFHEDMTTGRWIGFSLVWFALAVFTFESIHYRRRQQIRLAVEASARLRRSPDRHVGHAPRSPAVPTFRAMTLTPERRTASPAGRPARVAQLGHLPLPLRQRLRPARAEHLRPRARLLGHRDRRTPPLVARRRRCVRGRGARALRRGRAGRRGSGVAARPGPRTPVPSTDPWTPVAPNVRDTVTVPDGYRTRLVAAWGDPVLPGAPDFDPYRQTPESAAMQFGYNNDYVGVLPLDRRSALLVCNHEYTNEELMFPPDTYDSATVKRIAMASHGLSVLKIQRSGGSGSWKRTNPRASSYNRRVTATTPVPPRRPGGRRRPAAHRRRPERPHRPRHPQQLLRGYDAVGHGAVRRGELQPVLRQVGRARRPLHRELRPARHHRHREPRAGARWTRAST